LRELSKGQYDNLLTIFNKVGCDKFITSYLSGALPRGMIYKLKNLGCIVSVTNVSFGGSTRIWQISDDWIGKLTNDTGTCPMNTQSESYIKEYVRNRVMCKLSIPPDVASAVGIREIRYDGNNLITQIGLFDMHMIDYLIKLSKKNISTNIVEIVSIKHKDGSNAIGIRDKNTDSYIICCPVISNKTSAD